MKTLPRVDVAIVGGGWTGLLMAKELGARTGLSVVVLERGAAAQDRRLFRRDGRAGLRHPPAHDAGRVEGDSDVPAYLERPRAAGAAVRDFLPGTGVGGAGEHWNGITPRFLPDCFEILTRTVERYGRGRLPANHAIQDWGITYAELEPFYTRAEKLLGISGKTGLDPFEGPHSAEYPTPPQKVPYFPSMFTRGGAIPGLSSVSEPFGQSEPGLPKSGRHYAARLRVLRLLRAFRMHGGRQSAADQYADAGDRAAEKRDGADGSERPARAV